MLMIFRMPVDENSSVETFHVADTQVLEPLLQPLHTCDREELEFITKFLEYPCRHHDAI